jgi:leader peptidase (prepilin peptidase) / N-methyltransferase
MIIIGVWAAVAALFGLAIGSFLNVVIYRVPAGLSIVHPPSSCPRCGAEIRNRHNVPVLGWLVLRGRCYDCHAPISPRYPIVEAVTGALYAAVTARALHLHLGFALAAYLALATVGVVLAMVEIDHGWLPGRLVASCTGLLGALVVAAGVAGPHWSALARAGIAFAAVGVLGLGWTFALPWTMRPDAVALAAVLAGTVAYRSWTSLGLAAAVTVVLAGASRLAPKPAGRPAILPFVVCMIAGSLAAVFLPAG